MATIATSLGAGQTDDEKNVTGGMDREGETQEAEHVRKIETNDQQASMDSLAADEPLVVCRFFVKDLKGGGGYAKSDYYIDLVVGKHSLYDLVQNIFDVLSEERVTTDDVVAHLWHFDLADTKYANGWRGCTFGWNGNHLDECEPRPLNGLEQALANGQKGKFNGESAAFDVLVENTRLQEINASQLKSYPLVTPVATAVTTDIEDDWIREGSKDECSQLRSAWEHYYAGMNVWKRDGDTEGFIRAKPDRPRWGGAETEIMGLLINAGGKFKKSWDGIMQYAFLDRAEGAASQSWYKLRKEAYRREYIGRKKSNGERIVLAKRLAKSYMLKMMAAGAPKRGIHPHVRAEKALRKRGSIDDNTDPEMKRRKIEHYMCRF